MSGCDVYLENYNGSYTNGQTITGYVQVRLREPKSIIGVFIKFKGEAKTEWSEIEKQYNSQKKEDESVTVYYSGSETIFRREITLFGDNGTEIFLPQGVHKYHFNFELPRNIPSSFNGTYGKIKYELKAKVQRPLLSLNYTAESTFKVVSIIDFNRDLLYTRNPAVISKNKEMGFCCCSSGPINFQLHLPATGFALGENVPINLHVENLSRTSIEDVTFQIKQKIQYTVQYPSTKYRKTEEKVAKKVMTGVGAHGERNYNEFLLIPSNFYAPNLSGCSIMSSYYTFKVEAYLPIPHSNIKETISLKIGHIPAVVNIETRPIGQIGFVDLLETPPAYNPSVVPPAVPSMPVVPVPNASSLAPTAPPPFPGNELIDGIQVEPRNTLNKEPLPPSYEEAIAGK